jgi:hypothetical protein
VVAELLLGATCPDEEDAQLDSPSAVSVGKPHLQFVCALYMRAPDDIPPQVNAESIFAA